MSVYSYFAAGALIILAVMVFIRRVGNTDGATDWVLAWLCILLSGLDRLLLPNDAQLAFLTPLWDILFSALLLTGSLRFAGLSRLVRAVWGVAAVVYVGRLQFEWIGSADGTLAASMTISLAAALSSFTVWRCSTKRRDPVGQMLSFVFFLPVFAQSLYAYLHLSGKELNLAFLVWLIVGIVLMMVQMMLLIEAARARSHRVVEQGRSGLRNLAANVAHLFNNQLMVILGNAELIDRSGHRDIERYVDGIKSAANASALITKDFLRSASVPMDTPQADVSVRTMIDQAASHLPIPCELLFDGDPKIHATPQDLSAWLRKRL